MLNRVDFRGCCEKSELLERVQRLWDDLQNCPGKQYYNQMSLKPHYKQMFSIHSCR